MTKETIEINMALSQNLQELLEHNNMKIAIDVREAGGERTGKGFFAYGLISELIKIPSNNQYFLLSDSNSNPFEELAKLYSNVEYVKLPAQGLKWHLQALKKIKLLHPEIYFAPTSFIVPAFAPRWLKTIITVHDLVAFLFPKNHSNKAVLVERLTLKRALKKANKVVVVSENTQNDLISLFHTPKSLTVEIPCAPQAIYGQPLSPTITQKVQEKLSLPEQFILAVGTLEPRKNLVSLIKAFAILKRNYPDLKLVLVGKQGWKSQQINQTILDNHLEANVIYTGYLEDQELRHLYALATVFVFPSLYEGFGIPPLEAMSSGCPVITSNTSSLPEVVGDAGLLVSPKSYAKIADAISSVLDSPELRQKLIERGHKRVQRFTWSQSAQVLLETFQKSL